jgi:hypothetical protein
MFSLCIAVAAIVITAIAWPRQRRDGVPKTLDLTPMTRRKS